jgi:hypothetical protein
LRRRNFYQWPYQTYHENTSRDCAAADKGDYCGRKHNGNFFLRSVPNPCRNSERFLPRRNQPSRKLLPQIKKTVNPLEYAQEGDLLMPIMEINEKLTRIIQERSIELVTQEEGLVTIVFDDYSTASLRVP